MYFLSSKHLKRITALAMSFYLALNLVVGYEEFSLTKQNTFNEAKALTSNQWAKDPFSLPIISDHELEVIAEFEPNLQDLEFFSNTDISSFLPHHTGRYNTLFSDDGAEIIRPGKLIILMFHCWKLHCVI